MTLSQSLRSAVFCLFFFALSPASAEPGAWTLRLVVKDAKGESVLTPEAMAISSKDPRQKISRDLDPPGLPGYLLTAHIEEPSFLKGSGALSAKLTVEASRLIRLVDIPFTDANGKPSKLAFPEVERAFGGAVSKMLIELPADGSERLLGRTEKLSLYGSVVLGEPGADPAP